MLGLQEVIITKEDILEAVTLKILHTKTPTGYIGTTIKKSWWIKKYGGSLINSRWHYGIFYGRISHIKRKDI